MTSKWSQGAATQTKPAICKPPPPPLLPIPGVAYPPLWISVSWSGTAPDLPNPDREYNYTDATWALYNATSNLYRVDFQHGNDQMRLALTPDVANNQSNLVTTHWIYRLPVRGTNWKATLITPGAHWHNDNLFQQTPPYPHRYFYHLHT